MKSPVLIVDDDDDIREIVCSLLLRKGYPVRQAAHGGEALEQLQAEPLPALILLDLMMPHMSGEEFRERQLADARLAAIPVVVLSGAGDLGDAGRKLQVEAIAKPIELSLLVSTVARYCGKD
jgi:putative two-component system response regulator